MGIGKRALLEALNAPKFAYRYQLKDSKMNSHTKKQLVTNVLTEKFEKYLCEYSNFALFDWADDGLRKINRNYFWNEYANQNSNAGQNERAMFFPDRLNNRAFENSLQFKWLGSLTEYRCSFQNVQDMRPLMELLDSTTASGSKLRLHSLGLRVKSNKRSPPISSIASYIQPLLEESMNMYTNLNYDKLLRIAKQSKTHTDNAARSLLVRLAENGLSSPKLVNDDNWLLFTRDKHS